MGTGPGGGFQRCVHVCHGLADRWDECFVTRQDQRVVIRLKPAQHFLVSPPADEQPLAACGTAEVLSVSRQIPGHALTFGNEAVCRDSGDEGQNRPGIHSEEGGFTIAQQAHPVLDLALQGGFDEAFSRLMDRLSAERKGFMMHRHHGLRP